ncbi:hypothetical protein COCC4DRAFT_32945 [Bipolaris maydis ATCC 48331]|uniref:Uncharacterized protein n=2 Tax=Cochliobolus heterostrophus TaxID=5016 RepID=M2VAD1_COCH5|nr:uncharacterized protein COCC4DRAFT_32945 [Bipolaris maydis ATCC 48331]EMD96912.1 hypothetical protein COCHEDRAFT_1018631 [Bipolaris maydis C5]ENI03782.1 hypothetical protein COCC4DRAFT_32945 [Bipolaris maydis ATCC 48331]
MYHGSLRHELVSSLSLDYVTPFQPQPTHLSSIPYHVIETIQTKPAREIRRIQSKKPSSFVSHHPIIA